MKKILSVILVFVLCLGLVVPAQATTSDLTYSDNFINIFDYVDQIDYVERFNSNSITVRFPAISNTIYYGELIVKTDLPNLKCKLYAHDCTVISLGNELYRIIYNNYYTLLEFAFTFTGSGNGSQLDVLSFKYSPMKMTPYQLTGQATISAAAGYSAIINFNYNDSSNERQFEIPSADYRYLDYTIDFQADGSYKYDYVDILFWLGVGSIDSIRVRRSLDNGYEDIPFTVSFLDNTSFANNIYLVSVRMDLRNIDRSDPSPPVITVSGLIKQDGINLVRVESMLGYVILDAGDPINYWLRNLNLKTDNLLSSLGTWFTDLGDLISNKFSVLTSNLSTWFSTTFTKLDSIISGSDQANSNASNFNDNIDNQTNELDDLTGDLNSVTRPPLSDVNLSTSGMVDQSVVILATNGIGSVLSNQIILRVLIMSLTFALAGFILFGKR